jgi:glycosyltransferase involved in cell wall biosynthesis
MVHERFPAEFSRFNSLQAYKLAAIKRADHVICISESTRRDLHAFVDIPAEKVSVVHLGFDTFVAPLPSDRAAKFGKVRPYLLFVGNRKGYKNFTGLLRAVSQSRQLQTEFDIIAFGGGVFTSEEQALCKSLGYGSRQVRQITAGDAELGKLYRGAAALVYPSLYEGFGLPPLEAMAHGCPVVVSNSSSLPEVVGNAGEYFNPGSSEDMSMAIEKVVLSPETANQLIAKGFQRLPLFSWKSCAQATLNTYQAIVQ